MILLHFWWVLCNWFCCDVLTTSANVGHESMVLICVALCKFGLKSNVQDPQGLGSN
jgi:hypothetical protein